MNRHSFHSTPRQRAPAAISRAYASSLSIGTLNVRNPLTKRKLTTIIEQCSRHRIDIIALQEIGTPPVDSSWHPHHEMIIAPGPSTHSAGVAILIRNQLKPRCRSYIRSTRDHGRIIGVVIDISDAARMLIVSAYMPTGLDRRSDSSPQSLNAFELYREIASWSVGMQHVIVMGDLNETLSSHDRASIVAQPLSMHASPTSPIYSLIDDGFTDEYRRHHADAACWPGHTHMNPSSNSSSRLDYIWSKGIDASSSTSIDIHRVGSDVSDHHMLWMSLRLHQTHFEASPLMTMILPNLRAATPAHDAKFAAHIERRLFRDGDRLQLLAQNCDAASLNHVASTVTAMTRHSAFASFPVTGRRSRGESKLVQQLKRQRRDLSRLIGSTIALVALRQMPRDDPAWMRVYRRCVRQHNIHWRIDACDKSQHMHWLVETRDHVRRIRQLINHEQQRMRVAARPSFDVNAAATVHRMLDSEALPSHLLSVVDIDGRLTSSAHALKEVMARHFTSVFAMPAEPPTPAPPLVDAAFALAANAMLHHKPGIRPEWYTGLTADVAPLELRRAVAGAPRVSAPGADEVSIGVWRIAIEGSALMQQLISTLFTSCLRASHFPTAWKSSVIVPLVKDAKKQRTMSNIRPISLQSCLGKLFNAILARRLADIIAQHPTILNSAQRGFITGGATIKCIDELLDAWDWSRTHTQRAQREQYTILYDIAQAYDSVQSPVLIRSLTRIGLPATFTDLIADSLRGLTSCVRTAYGCTRTFDVERSLRQGDPLAN
jgi:exonuclease III